MSWGLVRTAGGALVAAFLVAGLAEAQPPPPAAIAVAPEAPAAQRDCEAGQAEPCFFLGRHLEADLADRQRGEPELRRAAAAYQRGCEGGYGPACTALASMAARGKGVAPDVPRAVALLQRACQSGDGDGCRYFAQRLRDPVLDLDLWIEELVLRGLLKAPDGYLALADTEDGLPVLLTPGLRLRDGTVTAIDGTTVRLEQKIADPLSPVRQREVRMALYPAVDAETASPPPELKPRSFTGARVTLRVKERPLSEVIASIARAGGLALETGPGLDALASVEAVDKPWDELLRELANQHGLMFVQSERRLRVGRSLEPRPGIAPSGSPITLDFLGADLDNILRLFADISGLNVIAPPGRRDAVSMRLIEMPWDQALRLILEACDLGYVLEGNVLRVLPADSPGLTAAPARWSGRPLSPNVRGADLRHVFTLLARATGVDLMADGTVQKKATFSLQEVPSDQLLDLLLDVQGLRVVSAGGGWLVLPGQQTGETAGARAGLLARVASADPARREAARPAVVGPAEVEARLQTLREVLPDGPAAETGASEVRALWEASARIAGAAPPLKLKVASPVTAPALHVPVEVEATAPLGSVIAFVDRLGRSVRLMELASLRLSRATDEAVRMSAALRLRYEPVGAEPSAALARKAEAITRTEGDAWSFLSSLNLSAAMRRVVFEEAAFDAAGVAERARVRGLVGWPDTTFDIVARLTASGQLSVQRLEQRRGGSCTRFEVGLAATGRRIEAPPYAPEEAVRNLPPTDELCHVDRDPRPGPAVRASGTGPHTLRLRDVDLVDVFRVLHAQSGQGFVVDGDVAGRVDVELTSVTLEEALTALGQAGLRSTPLGPLLHVSLAGGKTPRAGAATPAVFPGTVQPLQVTFDYKRRPLDELLRDLHFFGNAEVRAPPTPGRLSVMAKRTPWHELYALLLQAAGLRLREEEGRLVVEGRPGPLRVMRSGRELPSPEALSLSLAEFELSGIFSMDGGWQAVAYDPTGRLWLYGQGAPLRDGHVGEVGPGHLTLEKDSQGKDRPLVLRYSLPEKPPAITLGADTTRVLSPLLPDGTPDYAAALNARFGAGVTAGNNAAPELARVLDLKLPGPVLKGLGVDPGASGERFLGGSWDARLFEAYVQKLARDDPGRQLPTSAAFLQEWLRASKRPWREQDCPLIAEWLHVNEGPLLRLARAVGKPRFWIPLPEGRSTGERVVLSLTSFGSAANALLARSMLRLGTGDLDGAAADLLTVYRLGALVGQGPTLVEALIGVAVRSRALGPMPMLAARLDPAPARGLAASLEEAPASLGLAEVADVAERFYSLGGLLLLRRLGAEKGPGAWKVHLDAFESDQPSPFYETPAQAYDWDEALRLANRWFDLLGAGFRATAPGGQERVGALITSDLDQLRKDLEAALGPSVGAEAFGLRQHSIHGMDETRPHPTLPHDPPPATRKALGRLLAAAVVQPSLLRANVAANEAQAQLRIALAVLSLSAERGAAGRYPPRAAGPIVSGAHEGYVFQYQTDAAGTRFAYTASPEQPGHTGVRRFCADDAGRSVAIAESRDPTVADGRCYDAEGAKARARAAELPEKVEAKVRAAEAMAAKLPEFQREVQTLEMRREVLRRILPSWPEVEDFVAQLKRGASGSGVRIAWDGQQQVESVEGYQRAEITVRLTGHADAIEAYVPRIERMARLAKVAERHPTEDGAELRLRVFSLPAAPPRPANCEEGKTAAALLACCRDARLDLVPESRDRTARSCARLGELGALLRQMDELDAMRADYEARILLIDRLKGSQ